MCDSDYRHVSFHPHHETHCLQDLLDEYQEEMTESSEGEDLVIGKEEGPHDGEQGDSGAEMEMSDDELDVERIEGDSYPK